MNTLEKNQRFWSVVIFVGIIICLIWLLIGVFVLLLTSISTPTPADAFYEEIPIVIVNGEKISFIFTDNNDNEDLIIRTERKTYSGIGITEADVYISIENKGEKDQFVNLQTFFSKDNRKIISIARLEKNVEPYDCSYWIPDELNELKPIYVEKTCNDKWTEEFLSDFSKEANQILIKDISIKDKKGFQAKKKNQFLIKKDEIIFLKARIQFPPHIQDEFFIEAIGSEGGYGHLDPYIDSDIMKEDWDNVIGWSDGDVNGGVSSIDPAGQLYLDCRALTSDGGNAFRTKDIGTIGTGDYYIEIKFKGDVWDASVRTCLYHQIAGGTNRIWFNIGNGMTGGDGIIMYDGSGYNLIYSHTWDNDWHTIVLFVHNSQTDVDIWIDKDPATEVADVIDADCSYPTSTDGEVQEGGYGTIAGDGEYHIDYLYIGTDLYEPPPPPNEWDEDFEGFSTGTIDGQGNWTASAYPSVYQVSTNNPYEGSKHLKIYSEVSGYNNAYPLFTTDTEITTGIVEISFKIQMKRWEDPSIGIFSLWNSEYDFWAFLTEDQADNSFLIRERSGGDIFGGKRLYLDDSWATIKLTLNLDTKFIYLDVNYKGEDWTQFSEYKASMDGIKGLGFECFDCGIDLDDMGGVLPEPPPDPYVWGISPASGTEITELDTTLTIGYVSLGDYDGLYITFRHQQTGIFTNAIQYDISEIGDSGELEINLQNFNIEKNADWYLHAVATYGGYQYESELFLSGYGWNWTDNLTDETYYLNINIEGFEEIFVVSDFEDWYSENAEFDEPTAMFSAIAGFFDPIFSVIGEFGNRIVDYFDVNESYAQGYEIGRTISYFRYFVDQISVLLGGFPILLWLFIIILLLTGIFIFRLILKFIPFLGGS